MVQQGLQVVQGTAGAARELPREVARRSTEGTAEIGRTLLSLAHEQTRQNLDILGAHRGGRLEQGRQGGRLGAGRPAPGRVATRQPGPLGAAHAALSRGHPGRDDGDRIGCPAAGQKGGLASFPRSCLREGRQGAPAGLLPSAIELDYPRSDWAACRGSARVRPGPPTCGRARRSRPSRDPQEERGKGRRASPPASHVSASGGSGASRPKHPRKPERIDVTDQECRVVDRGNHMRGFADDTWRGDEILERKSVRRRPWRGSAGQPRVPSGRSRWRNRPPGHGTGSARPATAG